MEGGREAGIIIIHNIIKHSFDPMVHVQPNPQENTDNRGYKILYMYHYLYLFEICYIH